MLRGASQIKLPSEGYRAKRGGLQPKYRGIALQRATKSILRKVFLP